MTAYATRGVVSHHLAVGGCLYVTRDAKALAKRKAKTWSRGKTDTEKQSLMGDDGGLG